MTILAREGTVTFIMENETNRVAAYVVRRGERDGALEDAEVLRRWAREMGCRLTWVIDEADLDEVPEDPHGHRALLQLLKWRKIDGVVVVDRTVFGTDPVLQELLIYEIEKLGGEFIELEPVDEIALERDLIRRSIATVRAYDSHALHDRLRGGRATKAARGGYAYGAPAFGYQSRKGELQTRDQEQHVIRRMEALRRQGSSYRAIARTLNEDGYSPKRGKDWHAESVRRVLLREGSVA